MGLKQVSFVERLSHLRGSLIGGSTVLAKNQCAGSQYILL